MTTPDALLTHLLFTGSPDPGLAALFAAAKSATLPPPMPAWKPGNGTKGRAEFGSAASLGWYEEDTEEPRVNARITHFLEKDGGDWSASMSAATAIARALAPHVDWLLLSRMNSDGPTCLPDAPLLRYHGHVLVATQDLIQSRYEADPIHWPAGVSVEEIEGRILVSRGLEAVDDLDFLRLALPQNWALARQARAGATRYYGPPTEAEREIYGAAPAAPCTAMGSLRPMPASPCITSPARPTGSHHAGSTTPRARATSRAATRRPTLRPPAMTPRPARPPPPFPDPAPP